MSRYLAFAFSKTNRIISETRFSILVKKRTGAEMAISAILVVLLIIEMSFYVITDWVCECRLTLRRSVNNKNDNRNKNNQ